MSTSASKSSTEAKTESTTIDNRVAADNGAIVLGQGAKLETVSDDIAIAAINAALSASTNSTTMAANVNQDSLNFAKTVTGQSTAATTQALDTVRESNASTSALTESLAAMMQQNANPAASTNDTALKLGAAVAAVAVGGLALVIAFKKK